jgi:hypothetical protein
MKHNWIGKLQLTGKRIGDIKIERTRQINFLSKHMNEYTAIYVNEK